MKKKVFAIFFSLVIILVLLGCDPRRIVGGNGANGNDNPQESNMSVQLLFNGEEVIVDLYSNESARDFLTILPLTLVFDDYNSSEKTAELPKQRRLNTSDAPSGYDPSAGELGYYSPWGNMVIYHKDFGYAGGIVPLGKFRSGEEKFSAIKGKVTVCFKRTSETASL